MQTFRSYSKAISIKGLSTDHGIETLLVGDLTLKFQTFTVS